MNDMRCVDVFVQDAIAWLIATSEADSMTGEQFSVAVQDRAAYLAGIQYE
jgi:hypothetical protein